MGKSVKGSMVDFKPIKAVKKTKSNSVSKSIPRHLGTKGYSSTDFIDEFCDDEEVECLL